MRNYFHRINNCYFKMTSNNKLISNQFHFHPSGMVSGYNSSVYEHHWDLVENKLIVFDINNKPSIEISHVENKNDRLVMTGKNLNTNYIQIFVEQINFRPAEFIKCIEATEKVLNYFEESKITFERWTSGRRFKPGDRIFIPNTIQLEQYTSFDVGNRLCNMGSYTYSSSNLPTNFKVGRYCSIAPNVKVMGFQHPTNRFSTSHIVYGGHYPAKNGYKYLGEKAKFKPVPAFQNDPSVIIGNDVWISENVTIKQGVKIGDGAIVASHAVVTKDVPSYAVVGGVAAKILKYRFDEKTIDNLRKSEWWNYNILALPVSGDATPAEFLEVFHRYRDSLPKLGEVSITFDDLLNNLM